MIEESGRLTDNERYWLCGLLQSVIASYSADNAKEIAKGVLRKIEGVDKLVVVHVMGARCDT